MKLFQKSQKSGIIVSINGQKVKQQKEGSVQERQKWDKNPWPVDNDVQTLDCIQVWRPAPAEYRVTAGVCRWAGSVSFLRLISGEPQRRGTMPRM